MSRPPEVWSQVGVGGSECFEGCLRIPTPCKVTPHLTILTPSVETHLASKIHPHGQKSSSSNFWLPPGKLSIRRQVSLLNSIDLLSPELPISLLQEPF